MTFLFLVWPPPTPSPRHVQLKSTPTLFRQTSWKVRLWVGRDRHSLGLLRVLGTYCKTLKGLKETGPLNKWTDSLLDPETKEGLESKEFKWECY